MTETRVVNIKKEPCDVYIGRGSMFGNPFTHLPLENTKALYKVPTIDDAIECYREYFANRIMTDDRFLKAVVKLKGKKLGCFCNEKCHGYVIKEFLDKLDE